VTFQALSAENKLKIVPVSSFEPVDQFIFPTRRVALSVANRKGGIFRPVKFIDSSCTYV
jgi:hypothetical protein